MDLETEMRGEMRVLSEEMTRMRVQMATLTAQLASVKTCPGAGLCLVLEPRLRALETAESERKGAWKWLLGLLTLASLLGGVIATAVNNK